MTDSSFVFNSILPVVWVVAAAFLLAAVFAWLEWKKEFRFRMLRILGLIIAIASLLMLILRPAIMKEYDADKSIVLTTNFSREQADSLIALYPSAQLWKTNEATNYRNAQTLNWPNQISGMIYVVGDGFTPGELDQIHDKQFTYVRPAALHGITSLIVEQRPRANQTTKVHVEVGDNISGKILIKSPGKFEDSVAVAPGKPSTLTIRPKQPGRFLYSIIAKDERGATLDEQPLALDILPERHLRILILQEYPTSEIRYLKNFLSDRGHAITLRYQLSRNVYRHEFANSEQKKINRLDGETLSQFDLVLVDSDVIKKLAPAERKQLSAEIRNGLGLLILFNESPQQTKLPDDVIGIQFTATKTDTAFISIVPGAATMVRTLGATAQSQESLIAILQTSDRKILSGYRFHGIGKSGFNLTTETYRFLIEGNENTYAAIWTPLLDGLARKKQESFSIKVLTPQPVYANEPVSIEILAASRKPTLVADSISIPLTEDVLIDDRWLGKTWFTESGWHTLTVAEDSTQVNLYVYKKDELKSVRLTNQRKSNSLRQVLSTAKSENSIIGYERIPPFWFFLTFLLSAGFLWLSPKI